MQEEGCSQSSIKPLKLCMGAGEGEGSTHLAAKSETRPTDGPKHRLTKSHAHHRSGAHVCVRVFTLQNTSPSAHALCTCKGGVATNLSICNSAEVLYIQNLPNLKLNLLLRVQCALYISISLHALGCGFPCCACTSPSPYMHLHVGFLTKLRKERKKGEK